MGEPDELDALLDSYSAEAAEQNRRLQERTARSSKPRSMAGAREAGLQQPLGNGNKGYALLKRMGYQEGQGLGASQAGQTEPLPLHLKPGRAGLGVDERRKREQQARELQEEQERVKRTRLASETQQRFQAAARSGYSARQALKHLYGAWRVAEQLDEQQQQREQQRGGGGHDTRVETAGGGSGLDGARSEVLQGLLAQLPTIAAMLAEREGGGQQQQQEEEEGDQQQQQQQGDSHQDGSVLARRDVEPIATEEDEGGDAGGSMEREASRGKEAVVQERESAAGRGGGCEEQEGDGGGKGCSGLTVRKDATTAVPAAATAAAAPPSVAEQLEQLLCYLRERHCYCYFCGCQYDNTGDLESNCPGLTEDVH